MNNIKIACRTAAVAAILLGAAVLAGWIFGSEVLKGIIHGWVAMKANTAALLVLCGAALLLICAEPEAPYYALRKRSAFFLAALVVLAGFLTILEYVYGFNFGLDQVLFSEAPGAALAMYPGRMAVATALSFMLTGFGILLADLRVKRWTFSASEKIALAILLIASHSLIAYFYSLASGTLSNLRITMSPHTAVAFMFLGLGLILARPGGFVSILSGRGIPRTLVLITLPAAFIMPMIFGWLHLLVEKHGFSHSAGAVFASALSTSGLVVVILYAVKAVRKMGEDLQVTQFSVDNAVDAVLRSGPDGRVLYANKAASALLGYTREELMGLSVTDISESYKTESWADHWAALKDKGSLKYETELRAKNGSLTPVEINANYISQYGREYKCVYARDLTASRQAQRALREMAGMLERAGRMAKFGAWSVDLTTNVCHWSAEVAHIHEEPAGFSPPLEKGIGYYPPEWRQKITEVFGACARTGVSYDEELEIITAKGHRRWVRTIGQAEKDAAGRIIRVSGSFQDISERKRFEAELHKAKGEAEAANRAKRDFLSKMSHEIRTPMNAILGFSQLMRRDPAATVTQCQRLDIINRSGEHLLELINEVLEISRIESGRLTLNKAAFDLHSMLEDMERMFLAKAEAKGLRMELEMQTGMPRFFSGDQGKLRQVISNILSNAVKFTAHGGVSLRLRAEGLGGARFRIEAEVQDSGPGMTPEETAALFMPFEQTQAGRKEGSGTGLGLAISLEYSRLMGGGVEVASRPGEGSIFKVSVIMEEAGQADIAAAPALQHVKALKQGQPPCRVLIADDKEDNRTFLSELLGLVGFETRAVADGALALKEFEEWSPQIILMDLRMPGMDGREAIKRLRAMEKGKEVKIIAVSASAFTEVQQEARASGADEFIAKPFRETELFEKIGKLTGAQYIYEDQPGPAPAAVEETLTAELFAGCPAALLNRIRSAALDCDFDAITSLADQVEPVNLKAARGLRALAQKYDHKGILGAVPEGKP